MIKLGSDDNLSVVGKHFNHTSGVASESAFKFAARVKGMSCGRKRTARGQFERVHTSHMTSAAESFLKC